MPAPFISRSMTHAASPRIAAHTGNPSACVGTDTSSTDRAQFCKALRGVAHMCIDVRLRVGMPEAFLEHADAQTLDAVVERIGVAAGLNAALARIEPVRSGDDFKQQRVVAYVCGHRPARIEVISSSPMPV